MARAIASPAQVELIIKLSKEAGQTDDQAIANATGFTNRTELRERIDSLILASNRRKAETRRTADAARADERSEAHARLPRIPAGRYALGPDDALRLYKVVMTRYGTIFAVRLADLSDTWGTRMSQEQQAAVLAEIAQDMRGAAARFGSKTGVCGMCGIRLSDPKSVEAGIGPVCAKKFK